MIENFVQIRKHGIFLRVFFFFLYLFFLFSFKEKEGGGGGLELGVAWGGEIEPVSIAMQFQPPRAEVRSQVTEILD